MYTRYNSNTRQNNEPKQAVTRRGRFIGNEVLVLAQLESGVLYKEGRLPRPFASVSVLTNSGRFVVRGYDLVAAAIKATLPGQKAEYFGNRISAGVRNGEFKGSCVIAKQWTVTQTTIDPFFTELIDLQAKHEQEQNQDVTEVR